jgi:thymidine kinase
MLDMESYKIDQQTTEDFLYNLEALQDLAAICTVANHYCRYNNDKDVDLLMDQLLVDTIEEYHVLSRNPHRSFNLGMYLAAGLRNWNKHHTLHTKLVLWKG